jgi:hypothetical protein
MKRFFILLVIAIALMGTFVMADEEVLIDFGTLTADYPEQADTPSNNRATLVDFSIVAGSSFKAEEKAEMKTSLAINNWDVLLTSSSRTVINQAYSMTKEARVRDDADQFGGATVLGIRVHFPTEPFNSAAIIKPPFEIPAYADTTEVSQDDEGNDILIVPDEEKGKGNKFLKNGVVKNVGVLKSLSINVYGRNFPHTLAVTLRDQNNEDHQIKLGSLDFDGWKTLTWSNPNYISEVRDREVRKYPLYPASETMRKLSGFVIYRDASSIGGDFVTYIKDVSVVFDRAVLAVEEPDINDEDTWNIMQKREEARRNAELQRLGQLQVLRYLESKKMHTDETEE